MVLGVCNVLFTAQSGVHYSHVCVRHCIFVNSGQRIHPDRSQTDAHNARSTGSQNCIAAAWQRHAIILIIVPLSWRSCVVSVRACISRLCFPLFDTIFSCFRHVSLERSLSWAACGLRLTAFQRLRGEPSQSGAPTDVFVRR
jgi:hypothetical protein